MAFSFQLDGKKTMVFESVSLSPLQKLGNYIASFAPHRLGFLHTRDERVIEQTWQNDELVSSRVLKGEEAYAATVQQIMTEPKASVLERMEEFRNKNWLPKGVREEVDRLISIHRQGKPIDDIALRDVVENLVPMASQPVDYRHDICKQVFDSKHISSNESRPIVNSDVARDFGCTVCSGGCSSGSGIDCKEGFAKTAPIIIDDAAALPEVTDDGVDFNLGQVQKKSGGQKPGF